MGSMFLGCSALTSLDLSSFDTTKVRRMNCMFSNCRKLSSLDITGFVTANVIDMSGMFFGCSALTTLDLTNFDTSRVDEMFEVFLGCSALTTIYCNSTWDAGFSKDFFLGCTSLRGAVPYDESKTDASMANPETGYFSRK